MLNKVEIDSKDINSVLKMRDTICGEIMPVIKESRSIVILCIGTDRSTGDSLGPLVGDKLRFLIRDKVFIYGNLENPVHAKNLCETMSEISTKFKNPYIIAVDACLGNVQNIGKIFIEKKPLTPGAAMNKDLPAVGDLSITGIVNLCGAMEFMVLQNTRLFTVMTLADVISRGIYHSILKTIGGRRLDNKPNITEKAKLILENSTIDSII